MANYLDTSEVSLERVRAARIGVDGNFVAMHLRRRVLQEDPFWALNGSIPSCLRDIVGEFYEQLIALNLTPLFVFDGMYVQSAAVAQSGPHSWNDPNVVKEAARSQIFDDDACGYIVHCLMELGAEVYTAPYLAWAQLASFAYASNGGEPRLTEFLATPDLLMFEGVTRVFTEVNFERRIFTCMTKSSIADKMRKEYHDHADEVAWKAIFFAARTASRWRQGAVDTSKPFSVDDASLYDAPQAIITYCPVVTEDAECIPLSKLRGNSTIANLSEYFGRCLNSDVPLQYYFQFCNLLSPQLLSIVSTGNILDVAPFANSREQMTVQERIIPLRTQIVFQMIQDLQREMTWMRAGYDLQWQRRNNPAVPIYRPPEIKLDEWNNINPGNGPHTFTSVLVHHTHATPTLNELYGTLDVALGAVMLKALDLLGYFTHAAHANNTEVSSCSIYATALERCESAPEQGVVLIELLRTSSLTDAPMLVLPELPQQQRAPGILLAVRIMSLVQLMSVEGGWSGPCDYHVLGFNSIARAFQRNLRALSEVIAAMLIVNKRTRLTLLDVKELAKMLPFSQPLNAHAGMIACYILTAPEYRMAELGAREALLNKTFPEVKDIANELRAMLAFWNEAVAVVDVLAADQEQEHEALRNIYEQMSSVTTTVHDLFQLQ